jgi:acyl-CoA synthetase (AMP-forming)/AMP-acid ligase II
MRLHDFFDYHTREHPDTEFAVEGERRLTYRQARDEGNRLANALVDAGLQVGDRAAILSKNSIEYVLLYYACSKAGVALVPLNYRLAPPEWSYILDDSQAKVLFAAAEFVPGIESVRGELSRVGQFVTLDGEGAAGWTGFRAFGAGKPTTAPDRAVSPDDDVYQMYTSGTTGRPKGAVLTHRAAVANAVQVAFAMGATIDSKPGDRWLIVAPVYHAAAAITVFSGVYWCACLYIMADFVPHEVVRALDEENVTMTTLVPAMIQACLVMVPDVAQREYQSLRLISYGGSPIAEQTLRRAVEVFKCDFAQGYGMTETTAVISYLLPSDHQRALREKPSLLLSAGRPLVGTEVRLVDENDKPVPHGAIGEIIMRGPQLMRGYWNLPEATAEALRGGWMHTGDAGVMDEEGFIYIQDRVKDMIVSGGENVYPREVEEVLFQHAAVADAAVIGVPDARWGETVKAIVVPREGQQPTAEEIMEFCRGRLGGFKLPRSVDFVESLPRNPSGKVLKRELRERYWAGEARRVR